MPVRGALCSAHLRLTVDTHLMAAKKAPPKPVAKDGKKPATKNILNPESRSSRRIAARTEGRMSDKTKDRADRFVQQYLRDFNATQAFIRLSIDEGRDCEDISYDYAMNKGYEMKRWPYVANRIQEAMDQKEHQMIALGAQLVEDKQ